MFPKNKLFFVARRRTQLQESVLHVYVKFPLTSHSAHTKCKIKPCFF